MRTTYRRRIRIARYRKNQHKMRQRFRQARFESDRAKSLAEFHIPKVVILTGAGISAESGIQTYRSTVGLWHDHRLEDVATPEGYARDPKLVNNFYNQRRRYLTEEHIQPNAAHCALAKLESVLGDNLLLVTQNIDNLHERAGSKNLIHMHGELLRVRCETSGQVLYWHNDLTTEERCNCCQFPSPLRPHIVWFGETPLQMGEIQQAVAEADIFVSIGTSGVVYPAAGFVYEAASHGAHTVELNLEPTGFQSLFTEQHYGLASEVVVEWVERLLKDLH